MKTSQDKLNFKLTDLSYCFLLFYYFLNHFIPLAHFDLIITSRVAIILPSHMVYIHQDEILLSYSYFVLLYFSYVHIFLSSNLNTQSLITGRYGKNIIFAYFLISTVSFSRTVSFPAFCVPSCACQRNSLTSVNMVQKFCLGPIIPSKLPISRDH